MKFQFAVAAIAAASVSFAQEAAPESAIEVPAAPAQTAEAAPQQEAAVDGAEANKDVTVSVSAKDSLEDAFAEYAEKRGFTYGEKTEKGSIYYKGMSVVDQTVESATFIKSRSFAYERAYLNALSSYVMDFFGRETASTYMETFGNQSSDAEVPPAMTPASLCEKIGMLADAKLNQALAAAGVDPSRYEGAPIVEKRKLMQDTIVKSSLKKALHTSSGCLPVKTFESRGTDGRYYIGVVVRVGADCTTLANAFRLKKRPALCREGGFTVKEALPDTTDEMVQTFGVRLYFDETGTPALLSFGQFGSAYAGKSARMAERAEAQAQKQAKALADSALTMFINSFTDASEESELSEDVESSITFKADGDATQEEVSKIIDIYRSKIKQTGSDTMKGRTTVYDRFVTHPSGQRVAVCVRRWSFGQVDAVNEVLSGPKPEAPKPQTQKKTYDSGVRSSRTYDF